MRRAADHWDEVQVCGRHGGHPQGDEARPLQYNQGRDDLSLNVAFQLYRKVEEVSEPLIEAMGKVAEAVLLFCQVRSKCFQANRIFQVLVQWSYY